MFECRPQRFGAAVVPTNPGGTHRSTQAGICARVRHRPCGCPHTSEQLARFAREHNLVRSVGRTAVCWDKGLASQCTLCSGLGENSFSQRTALSSGEVWVTGDRWFV